jgi:hypothetical protein
VKTKIWDSEGFLKHRLSDASDKIYVFKDAADRLLMDQFPCTAEAIVSNNPKYRAILSIYTLRGSVKHPIRVFKNNEKAEK